MLGISLCRCRIIQLWLLHGWNLCLLVVIFFIFQIKKQKEEKTWKKWKIQFQQRWRPENQMIIKQQQQQKLQLTTKLRYIYSSTVHIIYNLQFTLHTSSALINFIDFHLCQMNFNIDCNDSIFFSPEFLFLSLSLSPPLCFFSISFRFAFVISIKKHASHTLWLTQVSLITQPDLFFSCNCMIHLPFRWNCVKQQQQQ